MNPDSSPLISIIMPAYNAEETIVDSIKSVLYQTLQNWELIIVNDNSTDNTEKVVQPYLTDKRIILICPQQNRGVAAARNIGIGRSRGTYVAFLDSDDIWLPQKLERQIAFLRKYPELALTYGDYELFDESGIRSLPRHTRGKNRNTDLFSAVPQIYYKNMIGILTVVVRKRVLDNIGGFDTGLKGTEDHDMWIRMAKVGYQFGYIREKMAQYRLTGGSLSRTLGSYKFQRKKLLRKHFTKTDESPVARLAWGTYYRHFGYEYYQRQSYYLAHLYYFNALNCFRFSKTGLLMFYFYLRSSLKSLF